MQFLAAFLVPVFTSIFQFLGQFLAKKTAIGAAMVAAVAAVTAVFYAAVQALMNGIGAAINDSQFLMVWWAVWPSNGLACISACFAADVAGFLWRYQKRSIEMIATV